ncbi:MAG: methyltransferase [Gemmatimonadaceae bacterium]
MNCCPREAYDAQFDDKHASKDVERFHKEGADHTTRALIDALRAAGVQGATLLDIGGGIGVIHHELLDVGVTGATHVDVSAAYVRAARRDAVLHGHAERVRFVVGDFVALAREIPAADVVTLDRVICCYADMEALVAASASRAKRLYGAVFPRDRWFLKIAFAAENLFKRLTRCDFRTYVHPVRAIDAAIRRQGLEPRKQLKTFVWNVVVYARTSTPAQ